MKNENTKNILLGVLIVGLVSMTVAFAALSTTLNISGSAQVAAQSWGVEIQDFGTGKTVPTGVTEVMPAETSGTSITGLSVSFAKPGLTAVYPFKIKNIGTIDAAINSVTIGELSCKDSENQTVTCPVTTEFACKATSDASTYTTLTNGSTTGMRNLAGATTVGGTNGDYSDCKLTITYPEAQPESGHSETGNVNQGEINITNITASWNYRQN